jgi:hypothetical protein
VKACVTSKTLSVRCGGPHHLTKKPAPTDAGKEVITGYPKGDGAQIERRRQLGGGRTVE